jgi:hypothetical protein
MPRAPSSLARRAGSGSTFSVPEVDLEPWRALHARYCRELMELIRASGPSDRVVLFAAQLYRLDRD